MGIVHPGIPKDIALFLKSAFKITTLIETGTQYGESAEWAARHFDHVVTIELSEELFRRARDRLEKHKNIRFIYGESTRELKRLVASLQAPTIFWLDAHWSLQNTAGEDNPCPLLDELKVILNSGGNDFILIDDARLFGYPPSFPHPYRSWPNLTDIHDLLRSYGLERFFLFDDVLIVPPAEHASTIERHLQVLDTLRSNNNCKYPYSETEATRSEIALVEELIGERRFDRAIEECERLTRCAEQPAPFHYFLYQLHREQQSDVSLQQLKKAVSAAPVHHAYRREYAEYLQRAGETTEAKEQLEWSVATKLPAGRTPERTR